MTINSSYLAGVTDSDGSLSIVKRNTRRPNPSYMGVFQLTWVKTGISKQILKKLKKKYGGCVFETVNHTTQFKNAKPILKYSLTTRKLDLFLKDIEPFLLLKKKQANLLIELSSLNKVCNSYGNGRSKPLWLKRKQESLYLRNKKLNK